MALNGLSGEVVRSILFCEDRKQIVEDLGFILTVYRDTSSSKEDRYFYQFLLDFLTEKELI